MATFSYRALSPTGEIRSGVLLVASRGEAIESLRRSGLTPIDAVETAAREVRLKAPGAAARRALVNAVSELSVLLTAGLSLDRALSISVENAADPVLKAALVQLQKQVKEGAPLSRAMAGAGGLFSPMACAMVEAGEADGRLALALSRLAHTLERAEALRQAVVSSMVYPILLTAVTGGVILMMLLFVVPQFESLFSDNAAQLPVATRVVMAASQLVRAHGLAVLLAGVVAGTGVWRWLKQPAMRLALDRLLLSVPRLGPLIKSAETARLARVLGSLVEGGVPLPTAMAIARRSLVNSHMAGAVERVVAGLKEGGGLTRPLAATGLFPTVAISFMRTGEETAQLPQMLGRLADVLDRDVRTALERFVALLTPAITIVMGLAVGGIIAAIMSAILGFNDMALAS
ncbi:type II secretion system F family protein [Caulobacter endophyticus]|uniref:type II secretion system F family protein n=1 Tax=Caulobacter endophyticus TaxID=2172652 RepID=UPI00240FF7D3|nr:type II secretion system F family protein [Caulobacter endophyticus]MDG2527276.1 type II secretion system F family protein [Caulobacter endophyticus]